MGKASRKKEQRIEKESTPAITAPPPQPLLTRPLPVLLLLALLATLIYSNTFSSSFHFDDFRAIVDNPTIKGLSNSLNLSGSRYIGFLTFALNYHFGGLNVFGYHLVNLLIHITNGFLVYCLALLLFKASASVHRHPLPHPPPSRGKEGWGGNSQLTPAPWIALSIALLFVAHPIQTQAVTYIVQRFASLATLFYLLTVVAYLKWRLASSEARSRYLWYAAAVLSTVLAMKTKEISFTLPLMLLLIEVIFFRPVSRKRWLFLVPFLLTLAIIPLSRIDAPGQAEAGFAKETTEISRASYLFTQFRVIVTYLRLLFLPIHQNLDYDYPIYHSLFHPAVFFSFLFLLCLFALAVYLFFASPLTPSASHLTAFGILWFFLTLSVESSIIPISDVIFEHRLYLPSVGSFLAVFLGIQKGVEGFRIKIWKKAVLFLFCFALVSLSVAAYQRNLIWRDRVTLWEDVVSKSPAKARGHYNLGTVYAEVGRLEDAMREYKTALRLKPDYADAHTNLGNAYKNQGLLEEAMKEYQMALKLKPDFAEAHYNLGTVYQDQGNIDEAIREYQMALKVKPDYAEPHNNLGTVYEKQGRLEEAMRKYKAALAINPNYAMAHNNLGNAYQDLGRLEEAVQEYQMALKVKPDYAEAHNNLGTAYGKQGRLEDAMREYKTALKLKPDYAEAHNNLGTAYGKQGRLEEAIREYYVTLELRPDLFQVYYNLGRALYRKGRYREAISAYEQALQIKPDFLEARQALESLTQ